MKKRIDILIFEQGLAKSRNAASELIKTGRIQVHDRLITKNSELFDEEIEIKIVGEEKQYVGRGGNKLAEALNNFKIDPKDLTVLDVGASTGGFTECLLRQGARKVYAIDVGTAQLDPKLKTDPRVVSLEQTDIRTFSLCEGTPEAIQKFDLIVIDVSFISLELVLEKVKSLIKKNGKIIALVKPQFETKQTAKNKSGIVKNETLQKDSLERIKEFSKKLNLKVLAEMDSPILGGSGNKEYFLLLQK